MGTIGKDEVVSDSDDNYFKTPMGADPNSVALESSNEQKGIEEQPEFIDYKNKMEDEMERLNEEREKLSKSKQNIENKVNKMENEIDKLQNEIERISNSKIALLMNTSKEINALRELLSQYMNVAKRQ